MTFRTQSLAMFALLSCSRCRSARRRWHGRRSPSVSSRRGERRWRRKSTAAFVVAFGGRTPISDFGPFHQLPAFHYLTNFDEADAAMVMVVRHGVGTTTLFLTPADPRAAFYYGWRPDSAAVVRTQQVHARSFSAVGAVADSLAASGLPLFTLDDFEDADFSRADSLTRGRVVRARARVATSGTRREGCVAARGSTARQEERGGDRAAEKGG